MGESRGAEEPEASGCAKISSDEPGGTTSDDDDNADDDEYSSACARVVSIDRLQPTRAGAWATLSGQLLPSLVDAGSGWVMAGQKSAVAPLPSRGAGAAISLTQRFQDQYYHQKRQ